MARSSRSKPAEELVELPEDESVSEEDADYSGDEPEESADEEDDEEEAQQDGDEDADDGEEAPQQIDPYQVLGVSKDASASQIRKVYHKAALKHHPDKVSPEHRETADAKFKEIAFAYGILSDDKKRKLYDSTGRADGEGSDFDWSEFMANQYKVVINDDVIENVKKEYVGSEEERKDVLSAYKQGKGSWTTIFEQVMLSVMLEPEDEKRFRGYIDAAIADGTVQSYKAYNESDADRKKRLKAAEREAKEAEKIMKKLNVKKNPAQMSEDELGVLIRSRQPESFKQLDGASSEALARHYEEKYGKKSKKRKSDSGRAEEPSEAEFQAAQERIKQRKK